MSKLMVSRALAFTLLAMISAPCAEAAQIAVVVAEPAYVYKKPDFDAQQISQLAVNQKVKISTRKFGPFYRVRLKQGILGYISDADVQVFGSKDSAPKGFDSGSPAKSKKPRAPWWNSFMVGVGVGTVRYTEMIAKSQFTDQVLYYGGKVSMPLRFLDGPFSWDITVLYHSGAPSYYNALSETAPTGFFISGEFPALFTLFHFWQGDGAFFLGAGPLASYSLFKTFESGQRKEYEELRVGAVAVGGMAFSMGRFVLKVEPRYYLEKANYIGALAGLQFVF